MSGFSLWEQILKRSCPHRFSWPRIDDNNRHYQICVRCGTAYEYDWTAMCRTNRLVVNPSEVRKAKGFGTGRVAGN
jgi:hypothetical protein